MSLFDFLKKEVRCEGCFNIVPDGQLNHFDSTFRGENPKGIAKGLCRACLLDKFQEYLKYYKHRAVIVWPVSERSYNAYQFYAFDEMVGLCGFTQKWVDEIKLFLPPQNAQCKQCNSQAHFNWCSPFIYFWEPSSETVNTSGNFSQEFLCGQCLGRKFFAEVETNDLGFDEFLPPVGADGLCTSWEA